MPRRAAVWLYGSGDAHAASGPRLWKQPKSELQLADVATAAEYSGTTSTVRRSGDALPSCCAAAWVDEAHLTAPTASTATSSVALLS
eukprot:5131186-Alexandrium_andersonii.AAC.1